jgi:hypothetical protein
MRRLSSKQSKCRPQYLIYIGLFFLTACSAPSLPRIKITQAPGDDLTAGGSYYLYPLQLGPTLADSSNVSRTSRQIEEKIKSKLTEKGYSLGPVKSADSLIKLTLETDSTGAATDEDIRLMKGVHHSNFPDPNPRIRSLEADFLKIEVSQVIDGRVIYSAKCRLFETQDALAPSGSVTITSKEIEFCVNEVIPQITQS